MTSESDISDIEEFEGLAIEYVVGALTPAERETVRERARRDVPLRNAVASWERRLSPLAVATPEVTPLRSVLADTLALIDRPADVTGASAEIIHLRRRVSGWRWATAAATAAAAALAIVVGARVYQPAPVSGTLVAVLQKDSVSPAFLVSVDVATRVLTVRPVDAKPEAGKSYELWIVNEALGPPKSLGLISNADLTVKPQLANYDKSIVDQSVYAVSLEPEGGSKTGAPTTVLYTAKLIPTSAF